MILKDAILNNYDSLKDFCQDLGMSERTLYNKLNHNNWTLNEVVAILVLLKKEFHQISEFVTPEYNRMIRRK